MKKLFLASFLLTLLSSFTINYFNKSKAVVIWQPSHQTDTGKDFSEAAVCNGIVEGAMSSNPKLKEHRVWSLNQPNLHHPNVAATPLYNILLQ